MSPLEKLSKELIHLTDKSKQNQPCPSTVSDAQYTLMKRASETEFPKFASPVRFDKEAEYVAQCHLYPCCSLLGSAWSFMTRLQ